MQKLKNPLSWQSVEKIHPPVLLMTDDADLYVPPSILRLQLSHFPGAESVVITEAGHCANWEQPEVFNKAVLDFIRKHSTR